MWNNTYLAPNLAAYQSAIHFDSLPFSLHNY